MSWFRSKRRPPADIALIRDCVAALDHYGRHLTKDEFCEAFKYLETRYKPRLSHEAEIWFGIAQCTIGVKNEISKLLAQNEVPTRETLVRWHNVYTEGLDEYGPSGQPPEVDNSVQVTEDAAIRLYREEKLKREHKAASGLTPSP